VLEPIRIRVGCGGVVVPGSPMRTRMRCSIYVSGVVSGSMFRFIDRGSESIGVPVPRFHARDKDGPVYCEPFIVASCVFASTEMNRPA
jgi:hypothetical protein